MNKIDKIRIANRNLKNELKLPAEGIILGLNESGMPMQVAWILGRCHDSRARHYEYVMYGGQPEGLKTVVDEGTKGFVNYKAMGAFVTSDNASPLYMVVSNGIQTEEFIWGRDSHLEMDKNFEKVVNELYVKPNNPTFLSRIIGLQHRQDNVVNLAINIADYDMKKKWQDIKISQNLSPETYIDFTNGNQKKANEMYLAEMKKVTNIDINQFPTNTYLFELESSLGLGYVMTTGGLNPSKSFSGKPFLVPLEGSVDDVAQTIWKELDPNCKLALVARELTYNGGRNYSKIITK